MTRRILRIGAIAMLALGMGAGCGSSDRPSELSLGEVQACNLIPGSEYDRLRVPIEPDPQDSVPGVDVEGTTCFYQVRNGNSVTDIGKNVTVSAITNHGMDRWIDDGPFERTRSKDVPRVLRFRTLQVWYENERPTADNTCRLYVDVAGGESLNVEVSRSIDKDDPPTCDTARQFADAAVQTLIDRN